VERLSYLAPDALNPPDEGAAAHMSLHHSNNEKEQTAQPTLQPSPQNPGEESRSTDLAVDNNPAKPRGAVDFRAYTAIHLAVKQRF
jgi:hypothetical protein